jgi:hypothetical protein
MNRRDVLKLGGAFSLALLLNVSPIGKLLRSPSRASARGVLYRGSRNGCIYTSADNGKSWTKMADFGPDIIVRGVARDLGGQVYARLQYQARSFEIHLLEDGKTWWTD